MLKRNAEEKIIKWLKDGKKSLLVYGAKRVGKTYLIKQSLAQLNVSYIEFNLNIDKQVKSLIENAQNINDLIMSLSLYSNIKISKNKTIIFLDNIEQYPDIVDKILIFSQENSVKFILCGSLDMDCKISDFSLIKYLDKLSIYPLDFLEFLQIYNLADDTILKIKQAYYEHTKLDEKLHQKLLEAFRQYLIVGGMPEAVVEFQKSKNINNVIMLHQGIMACYKNYFKKSHDKTLPLYFPQIYDVINTEQNENDLNYKSLELDKLVRFKKNEDKILWTRSLGLAIPAYKLDYLASPLGLRTKEGVFRLFLSDVGLLTTLYGKGIKLSILEDKPSNCDKLIYANFIAQELFAHGYDLFYINDSIDEFSFVIEDEGVVICINSNESKTTANGIINLTFNNDNIKVNNDVISYPIYMISLLKENVNHYNIIKDIDFSN